MSNTVSTVFIDMHFCDEYNKNMKKKNGLVLLTTMLLSLVTGCRPDPGCFDCPHKWGPWETILKPTCSKKGQIAHVCELCGEERVKSIDIEPDAHNWSKISQNKVKASCTTVGVYYEECSICGVISEPHNEPKIPHKITANRIDDVLLYKCENCDYVSNYELEITKATGLNQIKLMNKNNEEPRSSTWEINTEEVPIGNYEVKIEAKSDVELDLSRKYYNMSKSTLASAEDIELNTTYSVSDSEDDSDYRFYLKVNGTDYYPSTKKALMILALIPVNLNLANLLKT